MGLCWKRLSSTTKGNFFFFFCNTRASHCCSLSRCGAQAPDAQAQRPWLTGLAAPRHVGSSQVGTRTCVPCISRRTLNHCATREARRSTFKVYLCCFVFIYLLMLRAAGDSTCASPPLSTDFPGDGDCVQLPTSITTLQYLSLYMSFYGNL